MRTRGMTCAAFAMLSLGLSAGVSAVDMAPGAFVSPLPGTTVAAEPQLAGTVVADAIRSLTGTFTTTNEPFEVEVRDRVILSDDGTYDFYYTVTPIDKPPVYPMVVSRDGFAGFATNVGWRMDSIGTLSPGSASRTADGDAIVYDFGFNVPEGHATYGLFVDTDATQYALNSEGVIDFSPSFNVNGRAVFATYGPAVPEPAAVCLLAGPLLLVGRRRR